MLFSVLHLLGDLLGVESAKPLHFANLCFTPFLRGHPRGLTHQPTESRRNCAWIRCTLNLGTRRISIFGSRPVRKTPCACSKRSPNSAPPFWGIHAEDLAKPDLIYQLGVPRMSSHLSAASIIADAWSRRREAEFGDCLGMVYQPRRSDEQRSLLSKRVG